MYQSFNSMQKEVTSPSMMTFKEYYMAVTGIREPHLANGWGWFVDIELNSEPIKKLQTKYIRYKPSQYLSTIKEYPSIRSMKSMRNLHDTSMIFDMDYDLEKHITNKNISNVCVHGFCIITLLTICYYLTGII